MTAREIKDSLTDQGLTVADVVREINKKFPDVSEGALRNMIDDIIYGRGYYPRYVKELESIVGGPIPRPEWLKPAKERLRKRSPQMEAA